MLIDLGQFTWFDLGSRVLGSKKSRG